MSTASHTAAETGSESTITSFLAEYPRMIGVLFMFVLLLSQVGDGSAAGLSSIAGP